MRAITIRELEHATTRIPAKVAAGETIEVRRHEEAALANAAGSKVARF